MDNKVAKVKTLPNDLARCVPTFQHIGSDSLITETVIALAAERDGKWDPGGCATVIGRQLAITAKHVIEEIWKNLEITELSSSGYLIGNFIVHAIQVRKNAEIGAIWRVDRAFLCPFSDLAFLFLIPETQTALDYNWQACATIDLFPPRLGSNINCFGYADADANVNLQDDSITLTRTPSVSTGTVLEVHEKCRDSKNLNFPCFRLNAKIVGHMSGGAIFNEYGRLCGVISYSLSSEAGKEDVSYGALLWPSMATKVNIDREGFPRDVEYSAIELARAGFITAVGHENVFIRANEIRLKRTPSLWESFA